MFSLPGEGDEAIGKAMAGGAHDRPAVAPDVRSVVLRPYGEGAVVGVGQIGHDVNGERVVQPGGARDEFVPTPSARPRTDRSLLVE
jgi:hypothetical protein